MYHLVHIFNKFEKLYKHMKIAYVYPMKNAKWLHEYDNEITAYELRVISNCSARKVLLTIPSLFPIDM